MAKLRPLPALSVGFKAFIVRCLEGGDACLSDIQEYAHRQLSMAIFQELRRDLGSLVLLGYVERGYTENACEVHYCLTEKGERANKTGILQE